jgi:RNA polymerase sigma-70 factor (ECF subfamily)
MDGRGRRNRRAFEQFCATEYDRIVDTVAVAFRNTDLALDAVDEALARAWARVRRGYDIESLAGWVRVVAFNIARDKYRRDATAERHLSELIPAEREDRSAETWGIKVDVRNALAALPDRQRQVAVLFYIFDFPVSEIAQILRISQGTVKSSLMSARAAMATSLSRSLPEEVLRDVR